MKYQAQNINFIHYVYFVVGDKRNNSIFYLSFYFIELRTHIAFNNKFIVVNKHLISLNFWNLFFLIIFVFIIKLNNNGYH